MNRYPGRKIPYFVNEAEIWPVDMVNRGAQIVIISTGTGARIQNTGIYIHIIAGVTIVYIFRCYSGKTILG